MSELSLLACPICHGSNSLSRQTRTMQGGTYIWYECRQCSSVLLWMGGDRWAYQKVGAADKAHLLRQPLTVSDLQGLLPPVRPVHAVPLAEPVAPDPPNRRRLAQARSSMQRAEDQAAQEPGEQGRGMPRLFIGAIVLATLFLIVVVAGVVLTVLPGGKPAATAPVVARATETAQIDNSPVPPADTPTSKPTATWVPTLTPAPPTNTPGPVVTATPPGEDITDPNYLQGKAAYEAKDYAEVLKRMTLVLEADPNLAPPHWYRGMAYFYMDDFEAGLVEMEAALAIDPTYALGYADRGLMYSCLGAEERAMVDWQKALSLDPTLAKVHHNIAVGYYNRGDYTTALEEYTRAVTVDPNRAQTWTELAHTQEKLGDYYNCVSSADRAVELQPDLWDGYLARGVCRGVLGQYALAISDLGTYLDAVPDDACAWYNRGLCYRFSGDNQQALADYTRAIELDPTHAWALINRGNVYVDLEEHELALADYNAALSLGDIPRAYVGRGDVYRRFGRYEEAAVEYQKAIELMPGYAAAYARLAEVHLDQDEYREAIEIADWAFALDAGGDDEAIILQIRGRAYYGLGDYEQAIEDLSRVIDINPTVADFYYRGVAYQANDQTQQAIQDFEFFLAQGGAKDRAKIDDAEARLSELRQ